jgi:hypothetical protein
LTDFHDIVPTVVPLGQPLVTGQLVDHVGVSWPGIDKRNDERGEDGSRFAGTVLVVGVYAGQDPDRGVETQMLGQCDDVQIVANHVSLHDKKRFHPQSLWRSRRNDKRIVPDLDLNGLERPGPAHLAESGLNPAEAAHDGEWWLRRPNGSSPPLGRFDGFQDRLIPIDEIGEDVIVVKRIAVTGVEGSGGTPDQHGVRDDLLKSGS